jgi:hypothetical protein
VSAVLWAPQVQTVPRPSNMGVDRLILEHSYKLWSDEYQPPV